MASATSTTTATNRVLLEIPELFAIIISDFNMAELYLAGQVCRTWKTAISSDPRAQQTLFLRAAPVNEIDDVWHVPAAKENPLFIHLKTKYDMFGMDHTHCLLNVSSTLPYWAPRGWRNMLVSQLPCKEALIVDDSIKNSGFEGTPEDLVCSDFGGVRMGMLYDKVVELGLESNLYVSMELMDVELHTPRDHSGLSIDPYTGLSW